MLAQMFNPTEIKKNGQPQDQHTLQHGATASPSQQRPWCCLPPAKTTAMPETASTAIIGAGWWWRVHSDAARLAVQVQHQFWDALHAGRAPNGAPNRPNRPGRPKDPSPGSLAWPRDLGLPGDHCGSCRVLTISLQIMINLRFSL